MDELARYRDIIEDCLIRFVGIRYSHGDMECEAVFDRAHDRYLLVTVGSTCSRAWRPRTSRHH